MLYHLLFHDIRTSHENIPLSSDKCSAIVQPFVDKINIDNAEVNIEMINVFLNAN